MKRVISNIFFPKKCVACGALLPAISEKSGEERVLCAICRGRWEAEKNARCRYCGKKIYECRCSKDLLRKNGVMTHLKLARYRPGDDECVANKIIHSMKRKNEDPVFGFAAEQLSRVFLGYVIHSDIDMEKIMITYVPRNLRSIKEYGYDHAKKLASLMARSVSLEASDLLVRVGKSTEQKYLTKSERIVNVALAFGAAKNADARGKTVFIVDDVVTSGASMSACGSVLRKIGASDIVAVSFASTK